MSEVTRFCTTLVNSEKALNDYSKLLHLRNLLANYKKELEELRKTEEAETDEWVRSIQTAKRESCEVKKILPTQQNLDRLESAESEGKVAYKLLKECWSALPDELREKVGTPQELLASEKKRIHAVSLCRV